jgi:phosphoribosylformylglycinamidine synthase
VGADGQLHAIPGTLLISALGIVPDVRRCVTMDLKSVGNLLYVVGETRAEMGGSHTYLIQGIDGGTPPGLPAAGPATVRALAQAIQAGWVRSCHDCSEGGLAVALAEMALAGGLGLALDLERIPHASDAAGPDVLLFSESNGRFVVEVSPDDAAAFEAAMADVPCKQAGRVTEGPQVVVSHDGQQVLALDVETLRRAFHAA